jgi:hypothetical protein
LFVGGAVGALGSRWLNLWEVNCGEVNHRGHRDHGDERGEGVARSENVEGGKRGEGVARSENVEGGKRGEGGV